MEVKPAAGKRRRLFIDTVAPASSVLAELGVDPAVAVALAAEDIFDAGDLRRLTDADMRELGLKLGVRNKLRDWQRKHV